MSSAKRYGNIKTSYLKHVSKKHLGITLAAFICLKLSIERQGHGVKYVQIYS